MQRHVMSKKDAKEFLKRVKELYGVELEGNLEVGKEKKEVYYFLDGLLAFFGDPPLPTICAVLKLYLNMPYVVVDEGAVKAVTNGADLFAPGIVEFNCDCKEGEYFLVKTKAGVPVAVMRALMPAEKAKAEKRGKFGENLHHVGDELWETCKAKLRG
jgi:PUA domain protein